MCFLSECTRQSSFHQTDFNANRLIFLLFFKFDFGIQFCCIFLVIEFIVELV